MLTVDVATNLLATALWEVAIVPLYRGTVRLSQRRKLRQGKLGRAVKDASRHLASVDRGYAVPSESWRKFFARTDVQSVVRDVFVFRLDEDVSLEEIRIVFQDLWGDFAEHEKLPMDADASRIFAVLVESINQLLDEAINRNILQAHEALSAARHRAISDRLEGLRAQIEVVAEAGAPDITQIRSFEERLREEVGARHRRIKPPSLQGTDPVQIDELYVEPTLKPIGEPEAAGLSLEAFLSSSFRRVVLGHPGAGKSTLTFKVCALMAARYEEAIAAGRELTPWRIELRKFAAASERTPMSLVEYFEQFAATSHLLNVPRGAFERLLDDGRLFVIFDGLDELLDVARRVEVRDEVESFCRRFARTPVLITSRHIDYAHAPFDRGVFDAFDLGEFAEPQIVDYAQKWFGRDATLDPIERKEKTEAFLQESLIVPELRRNPLMLALLCAFYGGRGFIPRNLSEVYGNCAQLLFDTWDRSRGIVAQLSFSEHIRPALDDLAFWIFTDSNLLANGATRAQAVERTTDFLRRRRFGNRDRARSAAEQFIDHCRGRAWVFTDQSTTKGGEDLFGFTHRAFLEYFAAEQLAASHVTPENLVDALIERIVKGEWQVVSRIALQIKARSLTEGADAIINALRQHAKKRSFEKQVMVLGFILRSLGSMVPSPRTAQVLVAQTLAVVESGIDRADAGTELSLSLIEDLGRGGSELADQLVEGAAAIVGRVVRKRPVRAAQMASELAFEGAEILRERRPSSEVSVDFWLRVREQVLADRAAEFDARAAEDGYIAYMYAMATGDVTCMLDEHGVDSIFVAFASVLPMKRRLSVVQRLMKSLVIGDVARQNVDRQLGQVGRAMRSTARPWVVDLKTADADIDLRGVPRIPELPAAAWLGIWGIGGVAIELEAHGHRKVRLRSSLPPSIVEVEPGVLSPIGGLAEIWGRRGGRATVPLAEAIAAVPLASSDRETIRLWALGNISLVARPGDDAG